jgi:hypothetical protein
VADLDELLGSGIADAATDAAEVPEFGSVARRGRQRRLRRSGLVGGVLGCAVVCLGVATGHLTPGPPDAAPQYAGRVTDSVAESTSGGAAPLVPGLRDGPVTPGRYVYTLVDGCDSSDPIPCSPGTEPPPPLEIEITVPAGWEATDRFHLLSPTATGTAGPSGAGLVLGWTSSRVGLHSDPCLSGPEQRPDVEVGPTVDDFVDAVQADEALDVTAPTDVDLGGYPARHFTLLGPSDLSGCDVWRPWDPGFYVQGPDNQWDVWAVDVGGYRVVVVAQRFPETSAQVGAQLRDMVASIVFRP